MHRRNLLKQGLATFSAAATVGLAGCSGGGGAPFTVSTSKPYVMKREHSDNLVYVNITLEGNPDEWPEFEYLGTTYRGYTPKIAEGEEGNIEDATILYNGDHGWDTTTSWLFEKSEFERDQEETERVVLGSSDELQKASEFTLYLHNPESGENTELETVTYGGNPTPRSPTTDS